MKKDETPVFISENAERTENEKEPPLSETLWWVSKIQGGEEDTDEGWERSAFSLCCSFSSVPMAGLEQIRKKLLPLLSTENNNSLCPDMFIDASASYKVRLLSFPSPFSKFSYIIEELILIISQLPKNLYIPHFQVMIIFLLLRLFWVFLFNSFP